MPADSKRYIFSPVILVVGVLSSVVTIVLAVIQSGYWINENAVWALWTSIVLLIIGMMFLGARLAGAKAAAERATAEAAAAHSDAAQTRADAEATIGRERAEAARARKAAEDASAALEDLRNSGEPPTKTALGEQDRSLAQTLYAYASDSATLTELAEFFAYQIPRRLVRQIEELSRLPLTRAAHDAELEGQFNGLVEAAAAWLRLFAEVASTDGDDMYSTRLAQWVSQPAYKQHMALSDKLGALGDDLHDKLMGYQRYYASL
ncbi:hypothetical protein JF531_01015 [Microbacterium esteraromaticum]|uniref:hypothetical protein n=1 Tax=Microbacterium esteraromaticum TaxID=57043 RepID=UPI001A8CA3B6|nr:hypothetical protein [Microbacterium esteraromaticum]MBN8423099.1 hypothetical protein [Microbacterium esteraromaticum]